MARPLKSGLDYYPFDVNFLQDIKIRKILRACGAQSVAVLICLLGNIYKDEGYYMMWDEDVRFLIADEVGVKESLVHEVLLKAISVDFFDKKIFDKYGILTSYGIQKRYKEATSRRQDNSIKKELKLVNVSNNQVNVNNNLINDDRSTQSKVKESKVNKSKEDTLDNSVILEYKKSYPESWVDEAVSICLSKNKGVSYLEGILTNFEKEKGKSKQAKKTKFHNFKGHTDSMSEDDINLMTREMMNKRTKQ